MKVLLISCVFPPEHGYSAENGAQTAEELVRRGHSVNVYAPFPSHPKGILFDGYKRTLYHTSALSAGYKLTHCFGTFSASSTMLSRFGANFSFGVSSGLRVLFARRPDVIYSNSWPIFATGLVAIAAKIRRIPLVVRVQDVYPESLDSQRRVMTQNWTYRLLRLCDLWIARASEQLLVISPFFRRVYENDRAIPAEKVKFVPNWGSDDLRERDPDAALAFRRKLRIPEDAFVAVYAGNVGIASNAKSLVDAAEKLKDQTKIYVVIAGDGSLLDLCRDEARRKQLERVVFHSPWKREETGPVLQMADVLLLPTVGMQSLNSIPSKLITYLLSARPVIAAVLAESDTADAIRQSGAGWVISPDSEELMAKAISAAREQPRESLLQMGNSGREYALRNLTKESNLPKIIDVVEKAAKVGTKPDVRRTGSTL